MQYGQVPGIEKPVSRLVQGIGAAVRLGEEDGFGLLDTFLANGVTVFDTGRVYGKTDKFLGDWIQSRGVREQVVILGKGAHHGDNRQRVTPEDIEADLLRSLDDLQTNTIDLYILHRDDPTVEVGPIVEALNAHQQAGRISAFGGSNWTHTRIKEANEYAQAHGLNGFVASNPQFSLVEQIQEPWENCVSIGGPRGAEARAYYAETKLPLFTWSSLAGGFLSGRITSENAETLQEQGTGGEKLALQCYSSPNNFARLERAEELAQKRGVTLPQIALSYVLHQPMNIFALVGSATEDELKANIAAFDVALELHDFAFLEKAENR